MDIYEKIRMFHNIFFKNNLLIKKKTYSMDGEDLFIDKFFKNKTGLYVDVGAYHPLELSNTYLLHKRNWEGINIDINSLSIDYFNFLRPKDININLGVSKKNTFKTLYYQKKKSPLNTLNLNHAKKIFSNKFKKKKIKVKTLTSILDKTKYKERGIDFLNIDTEGNDLDVLKSLDFKRYKPQLICVELIDHFKPDQKKIKKHKIYKFLIKKKYKLVWSGYFSHIFSCR